MKTYRHSDAPLEVHGIPFFDKTGEWYRLPPEITDTIETLSFTGRRSAGARICFRTDATEFTVKVVLKTLSIDIGLSIYACQSAHVLIGPRHDAFFPGHVRPDNYDMKEFQQTFTKSGEMEDITLYVPRNEILDYIEVTVPDDAKVEPPTPYKDIKPIVFYGPSYTEQGNCSTSFVSYTAILCERLNVDHYNMGFSGTARGEAEVAEYIKNIDMSLFVYDYEENAPTVEHLEKTHKPFFDIIRKANPALPIIIVSKMVYRYTEEDYKKRDVLKQTYLDAKAAGDENVYFVEGESLFGEVERMLCFMDEIHPNDIGMLMKANGLEPLVKQILKTERV